MLMTIITALIGGLVIGLLARAVVPGKQAISLPVTIILGILGSVAGSWLYTAITGKAGTKGIDWIAFLLGVVVAAILVAIYCAIAGRSTRTRV